ncbi:right-handed parallel beta-helix repeat-containing protein [Methanobrevibacter sp.]|uniref:right-handed parallel beta-helix repeat-containing protein n=1 Tax=Methanobrevibacter sp. TaxID=66852 RepID=UPI0025F372AC|nr:right-handed parallel beta-helix repeat-containing protein [Methanobrevibacter sp.]MBQ2961357.1 right-handed parallel beta-helix repeat-containing protein [Methanobrevibacter sp.]
MKLPSILALIVILFLSLSAVSASDNIDLVTNASDSIIDDSIGISDSNDDLDSNIDDSNHEISDGDLITDSDDSDDEIASSRESRKLGNREADEISASEPIIIDSSSYSTYFDSNGKIKSGTLKDGDTIKIKSISNKIFTINKRLNIISDDGDKLSNCLIRLVEGSSGSVLNNLKIINTKEKITGSNYYLSGISIINSANNTISNSTINVSVHKCFAIMMSNASCNKIISNTLISGLSSTIPMTASSYNEIRDNYIESEYTNMVYQSAYGNGDFMPIDGEVCSGNIIANNYLKSRNGTYNSYCYAIYLMQSASGNGAVIANNTIENAFYAIIVDAPNTLIYNNTISNVGGPAAILTTGSNITVSNNNISTERTDILDWNEDGNVVAIQNTGKNNIIANNTLKSVGSDSILNTGENVIIANNTIYTESANCINTTKSNAVIENNTLKGINSSGVIIFTSRLAENITIRNNDISTDKSAIVLRGNVSYTLVCDNRINVSGGSDAIAVLKYTNRNPITPSHNAIYNNTINGQIVNMTDPSEIERNDTDNGTDNGTSGGDSGTEGNYSDDKTNTGITIMDTTVVKGNYIDVFLKDKYGNPISGQKVIFTLQKKNYERITDSQGKASLQINANIGNYAMNISYAGNDDYNPSKISTKINVKRNQFIVTEDNFYTCFDENGYLKADYEDYELIFKGSFSDKRIILDKPVYLNSNGAKLLDSVIKIESDNVIVNGFKIINSNPGNAEDNHRFAILLDNVKNVNVTNNNIQLSSYDNGYGIYVSESSNCNIQNNTIKAKANALTFGIMLYDSNNNTLKSNNIFVNGTSKPHLYDSSIKVDSSISVDDNDAEGMVIPEVYKTYGIILFYSSSNDIGYNNINATSGVDKYYTAVQESTNSIVGIDLYYESSYNKVHNNNVNVTSKDPYLYGLGVLGAETGKRDQVSANNSFTDNNIHVNGTYYAAGIIAGYNSINTTMARNRISCTSNNVSYGAILEGADNTKFYKNNVTCNSRINYLVEGYDADGSRIYDNHIGYGDKALVVRGVSLYNSNNNRITNNSLPSLKPLIPRIVKEINRIWELKNPSSPLVFTADDIIYNSTNSPMIIRKNGTDYNILDLLDYEPTSHADVISPENQLFDDIGGKNNTFDNNKVRESNGGSSGSGSNGSNSGGNNSGSNNSNGESNGNGNGSTNSGEYSNVNGTSFNSDSNKDDGNGVGTSSSAPVSQSAAYNLNVDEDSAAARSLSLGGMNAPVLIIIILLILACAAELIKRSKRDIK